MTPETIKLRIREIRAAGNLKARMLDVIESRDKGGIHVPQEWRDQCVAAIGVPAGNPVMLSPAFAETIVDRDIALIGSDAVKQIVVAPAPSTAAPGPGLARTVGENRFGL